MIKEDSPEVISKKSVLFDSAKYLALISFFMTAASILANILVFRKWGVNFASVASTSDIILGGINALLITFILFLIVGMVIFFFFLTNIREFNDKKVNGLYSIFSILLALSLMAYLFVSYYHFNSVTLRSKIVELTLIMFFLYLIVYMLKRRYRSGIVGQSVILVFIVALSMMLLIQSAENGQGNLVLVSEAQRCPDSEYVVWSGSEAIITSCKAGPYKSNQEYFIIERRNLLMKTNINK